MNARAIVFRSAASLMLAFSVTACGPDEAAPAGDELVEISVQELCSRPTNYPWTEPRYAEVKNAMIVARDQICDAYVFGASGPDQFDCSGLAYYAYRQAGFGVTRRSAQDMFNYQRDRSGAEWGSLVGDWEKRPGDLIYYGTSSSNPKGTISHVAIYLGVNRDNGKHEVVQALNPSSGVVLSDFSGTFGLYRVTDVVGRVKY